MSEKQKNQSMVNAFGTGKPPVTTVRRRGETRQQQRARGQGVDPNSDINAIFSGMQQLRTRVHKGLSGMPLNPDGTDPGNSFDRFMKQNPHLQGAAQRQTQYDQQQQEQFQRKYPNASGYSALFPGKSSPPGGGQGDRVGSSNPSGEPGGETLFGQMPNVQGEGMQIMKPVRKKNPGIEYGARQPVQQEGWNSLFPQQTKKSAGPMMEANAGPQLPYSDPFQLDAMKRMLPFVGGNNSVSPLPIAALNVGMSDIFPGQNDWEYLQMLFPQLVNPAQGTMANLKTLMPMLENPAYRSQMNNIGR